MPADTAEPQPKPDELAANVAAQVNRLYTLTFIALLATVFGIIALTGYLVSQGAVPAETFSELTLVGLGLVSGLAAGAGGFALLNSASGGAP